MASAASPRPFDDDSRLVVVLDDVVNASTVHGICAAINTSALMGSSQLVGGFSATRGFGLCFHAEAVDDAIARVPFLEPFLRVALHQGRLDDLRPPSTVDRLLRGVFGTKVGEDVGDINAVYANVLAVGDGQKVERHTDATLGTAANDARVLVPRAVVVLYVDVPDDLEGGILELSRPDALISSVDDDSTTRAPVTVDTLATVRPRSGRLVLFDGRLAHAVTMAKSPSGGRRLSCVAELYRLPRQRRRLVPRVRLQSNGFADVLARLSSPR